MSRYHGFTCPQCGSHYFRTLTLRANFGVCTQNEHSGNGCNFGWDRTSPKEQEVMHSVSSKEWMHLHDKDRAMTGINTISSNNAGLPTDQKNDVVLVPNADAYINAEIDLCIRLEAFLNRWVLRKISTGELIDQDREREELAYRWDLKIV